MNAKPEKRCLACGRWFSWRKKWASCWEQVSYCSKACRGTRISAEHRLLTSVLFSLLEERAAAKTLCPSEVARRAAPETWRDHMPAMREVSGRLASFGAIAVTQGGEFIDPRAVSGPFRVGVRATEPSMRRRKRRRS